MRGFVAVGPFLMNLGFDSTGSYRLALGSFALATLAAAFLLTRLGPYPRAAGKR